MTRVQLTAEEAANFIAACKALPSRAASDAAKRETIGQRDATADEQRVIDLYSEQFVALRKSRKIVLGAGGKWYKQV